MSESRENSSALNSEIGEAGSNQNEDKATRQRNQTIEDDNRLRSTQGGRGGGTAETEGPATIEPLDADRNLVAGRGW